MTTIDRGGGPTLEQKRAFSGLKDGAHIPGYRGHCPDLKFRFGKTFGQETSELLSTRCERHQAELSAHEDMPPVYDFQFSSKLPQSTGQNKYTENMTPGYTGYVPRWPFKFGKTYREECDICLSEFLGEQSQLQRKDRDVRSMTRSLPSLQPVCAEPQVCDHLNRTFYDRRIHSAAQTRRSQTEAPIPGYRGYIPRVRTTEIGLGSRYHETTKNGLDSFYTARYEREKRYGRLPDTYGAQRHELAPTRIHRSLTTIGLPVTQGGAKTSSTEIARKGQRLYVQDGMIPNYTGYVPQHRYAMGYTFGDETRSLEVCAHEESCYGDYVKQQKRL